MEEVASDLPVDYVWRAIMACGVSVGVAQILYAADVGEVDYASLVISGPDSSTGWKLEDLPLVVVLAACAGGASAAFTRAADWFGNQRRIGFASLVRDPETSRLVRFARSRLGQFIDAILGAAVLATCQMVLPAFFSCRAAPSAVFDEDAAGTSAYALEHGAGGAHVGALFEASPPSRRRGLLSSAIYVPRTFVQYTCAEGEFSEMATLMLQNEEGVVKHLFARDELYSEPLFTAPVVAAFLAYFFVIASVTFGGAFPAGVFIPNMLMGATLGRLFGFLAERVNPGANKGTYALIGSAAMLSGFTRMTAAVVVIIIEATASLDVLAPIILACVVARAVASALVGHSLDERLIVAKGVPFLEREPHPSAALVRVGEALGEADTRRGPVIAFRPQERLEVLLNAVLLTEHNAFPVLEDVERNGGLLGLVTRATLQRVLRVVLEEGDGANARTRRRAKKEDDANRRRDGGGAEKDKDDARGGAGTAEADDADAEEEASVAHVSVDVRDDRDEEPRSDRASDPRSSRASSRSFGSPHPASFAEWSVEGVSSSSSPFSSSAVAARAAAEESGSPPASPDAGVSGEKNGARQAGEFMSAVARWVRDASRADQRGGGEGRGGARDQQHTRRGSREQSQSRSRDQTGRKRTSASVARLVGAAAAAHGSSPAACRADDDNHFDELKEGLVGEIRRGVTRVPPEHLARMVDLAHAVDRAPWTVDAAMRLGRAHALFARLGVRHLCVTSESGKRLEGIITRHDLIHVARVAEAEEGGGH
jgi:chloride channel 7